MGAREDGLVREEKENRVVSREDTTELTEIEDVKHFGDFSDKVSEDFQTTLTEQKSVK
jgi:hypothetical protein